MYTRYNVLKHIIQNFIKPNSYNRFQSSANIFQDSSTTNNRYNTEDIFLDLTTDYNRKRFVQSELVTNAIKNINNNISERLSLLILTAAARCVHHVTPEKRVELLEDVK
jgi:hypothetical protein